MRVLVVVSGNHERVAPFVVEQAEALRQAGCDVLLFTIEGHGAKGYLRNLRSLKQQINEYRPDVVHAHYGLCGLLCTLQHKVPVVVTYHGSDINDRCVLPLSRLAMRRTAHNIFVSRRLMEKAYHFSQRRRQQDNETAVARELDERTSLQVYKSTSLQVYKPAVAREPDERTSQQVNKSTRKRFRGFEVCSSVIPCGVDTTIFHPILRDEACRIMQLDSAKHYVLFAGAFDNEVKNPHLAKEACAMLPEVTLLELKGYKRTEVATLMNAVDCLLMTSHSEGSPQVIKEALACGCPIVSVDVGDVAEQLNSTNAGIITDNSPESIAAALCTILDNPHRINRRQQIIARNLENSMVAQRLISLYSSLL